MRLSLLSWALPLSLFGSLLAFPSPAGPSARAAAPPIRAVLTEKKAVADYDTALVKKVRRAVDEGVRYLKQKQRLDGGWEAGPAAGVDRAGSGGWTALALWALLNAGVKTDDPAIRKGLVWLRKVPPERSYVTGLQTAVFCLAGEKKDHDRIRRNVKALLTGRMDDGWTYNLTAHGDRTGLADNSNTQYALLGLHEAIQSGVAKVNEKLLREIHALFVKTHSEAGGWSYRPGARAPTLAMTTAGLCNLIITGTDLARGKAVLLPDGSAKNCGQYKDDGNVLEALSWIGDAFPEKVTEDNAAARLGSPFYCLYGIERAGRLTGQRYFGGHDWYEVGCRFLVGAQKADGSWNGAAVGAGAFDWQPVVATSFALLFLSKGRTPILISKLAYGDKEKMDWNNKRNDVKHLVEFAGRELFKNAPLAWQAFDIRDISAEKQDDRRKLASVLLSSPIVFFNGHDQAPRDKAEVEVLREYVSNGGFILAEACCGKKEFDRDFRKLMAKLFPKAQLKPLKAEHPVWKASGRFISSPKEFSLLGIEQGCKTVVIYSPKPIAGY